MNEFHKLVHSKVSKKAKCVKISGTNLILITRKFETIAKVLAITYHFGN